MIWHRAYPMESHYQFPGYELREANKTKVKSKSRKGLPLYVRLFTSLSLYSRGVEREAIFVQWSQEGLHTFCPGVENCPLASGVKEEQLGNNTIAPLRPPKHREEGNTPVIQQRAFHQVISRKVRFPPSPLALICH